MLHRLLNSLILLPERYCYQIPADLGLQAEEVVFHNAQGHALKGLFFWQPTREYPLDMPQGEMPVVLFCPGTSGNLSSHLYYVEVLCRAGLAVLGFDYTGFGQSAGQASLHSLVTDALCAGDFLYKEKQIKCFGIFGISIGANVALLAATLQPDRVRGVAVEGIAMQTEVARGILKEGIIGPRYIETITYEGKQPRLRESHVLNSFRIGSWCADVLAYLGVAMLPFQAKDPLVSAKALNDIPVLFIHGVEDPLLPFEATLQAYAAKPGEKRLWLIPEVSHAQEPVLAQDAEYAAQLGNFFHGALRSNAPPDSDMPPITCNVMAQSHETFGLRFNNAGPAGLALTTIVRAHAVDFKTLWVQNGTEVSCTAKGELPLVSCIRLFEVAGGGENTACIRPTARGCRYKAAYQPYIRELSRTLHEGRLKELEALLYAIPQERPEAPFDFFLGLYCVQIMQRTKHKLPHIAKTAAEIFTRYWHYGTHRASHGVPSLWGLASTLLNKQVGP